MFLQSYTFALRADGTTSLKRRLFGWILTAIEGVCMKMRKAGLFLLLLAMTVVGQAARPKAITPAGNLIVSVQVSNPSFWASQVRLTYFYQGQFITVYSLPNSTGRAVFVINLPFYLPGALLQTNTGSVGSAVFTSGNYWLHPSGQTQLLINI